MKARRCTAILAIRRLCGSAGVFAVVSMAGSWSGAAERVPMRFEVVHGVFSPYRELKQVRLRGWLELGIYGKSASDRLETAVMQMEIRIVEAPAARVRGSGPLTPCPRLLADFDEGYVQCESYGDPGCEGVIGPNPVLRIALQCGGAGRNLSLIAYPFEDAWRFFRRGDVDGDGKRTLTDPIALLLHLFLGGREPSCPDAADSDDDGELDIADAVLILNHLFLGGDAPAEPEAGCGLDLTEDGLPECHPRGFAPCPTWDELGFCYDGLDNDADGWTDCGDPDCTESGFWEWCRCADGVDDDGNGYVDCEDEDCLAHPACWGG